MLKLEADNCSSHLSEDECADSGDQKDSQSGPSPMSSIATLETLDEIPSPNLSWEIAEFLAGFVKAGNLTDKRVGDDRSEVWLQRLDGWWNKNPFVESGTHLAYLLRNQESKIVGFHGMIPFGYVAGSEQVPALITTTFFIEERYRGSSMKIVVRVNKLAKKFLLLDGTPSLDMKRILNWFHFEHLAKVNRFQIRVRPKGLGIKSKLLQLLKLSHNLPLLPIPDGLSITNDAKSIRSIPTHRNDGNLHRIVSPEILHWTSNCGTDVRRFFGLVDSSGELKAFAFGMLKFHRGVRACRILEYRSFDDEDSYLMTLISQISNNPEQSGLPAGVDIIMWSVFEGMLKTTPEFAPTVKDATCFYKLPEKWANIPKNHLPCEGDQVLL